MYLNFEENYKNTNKLLLLCERMLLEINENRVFIYEIYLSKVSDLMSMSDTRPIFEKAIKELKDNDLITIGFQFAMIERKLGEIDRTRGIYAYISQYCEPEIEEFDFWKVI